MAYVCLNLSEIVITSKVNEKIKFPLANVIVAVHSLLLNYVWAYSVTIKSIGLNYTTII